MDYEKKLQWTKEYRLRMKKNGKECSVCKTKDVLRKNLCESCYRKELYHKQKLDPEWAEKRKLKSRNWYRKKKGIDIGLPLLQAPKGSGTQQYGYRILTQKNHPNAGKYGRVLEHVVIMSNHLNRALYEHEIVHHKNGIRNDNRIDNLELWTKSHPPGSRVEDKIKWAKEFLESYGYNITRTGQNNII